MLDEPTNDLDVETLRALEEALLAFAGCVVVISHDRWFLDRIATHMLAFEGDCEVGWFEGNFQDYMEDLKRRKGVEGHPAPSHQVQAANDRGSDDMNVFIDTTGAMYFGDERETARNCPHCHALSRMSPTALPTFDELLLAETPLRRTGPAVSRVHGTGVPVVRHARVR